MRQWLVTVGLALASVASAQARDPFVFADTPRIDLAARGPADVLVEGRLGFGFTGRLAAPARTVGWIGQRSIAEGEAVYGVPLHGSGTALTWCAPRRPEKGWRASCIVRQHGTTYAIVDNVAPAFLWRWLVTRSMAGGASNIPGVTEQPVDFGVAVTVRYRVVKWSAKDIRLVREIDTGDGEPFSQLSWVRRQADGSAVFDLAGGRLRVVPAGDGYSATVEAPLTAGGNAVATGADLKEQLP